MLENTTRSQNCRRLTTVLSQAPAKHPSLANLISLSLLAALLGQGEKNCTSYEHHFEALQKFRA